LSRQRRKKAARTITIATVRLFVAVVAIVAVVVVPVLTFPLVQQRQQPKAVVVQVEGGEA
jgi:hypothetical protein